MNFKIETVKVEAKSHVLKCACGSEQTYMTARAEDTSRITMRCDECIQPGDLKFDFNDPYVERHIGINAEDEIVQALANEIRFLQYEPYANKYSSFEEKYFKLLNEAMNV